MSKILESRIFGAAGQEFATGSNAVISNSESSSTESCEIRKSWLMTELKNGSVDRVFGTQL